MIFDNRKLDSNRRDFEDWFVVDLRESDADDFRLKLRNLGGGCRVVIFDSEENELEASYCNNTGGARSFYVFSPGSDRLYVRLTHNGGSAAKISLYELFASEL